MASVEKKKWFNIIFYNSALKSGFFSGPSPEVILVIKKYQQFSYKTSRSVTLNRYRSMRIVTGFGQGGSC